MNGLWRINRFWRFLAQIFLTQLVIKWLFKFPPHPTSVSTLRWENRTNEIYALKWTTNVNKLEIRSHKNWSRRSELMKYIVYLLTYCSTSCYQTRRCWWHGCVSAVQCSAPAHRRAKRSNCWSAKPQTSSLRICGPQQPGPQSGRLQALGGHATAGLSDDVQQCGWTQKQPVEIWIGLEQNIIDTSINNGENICMLELARRADISNIYCRQLNNWTVG